MPAPQQQWRRLESTMFLRRRSGEMISILAKRLGDPRDIYLGADGLLHFVADGDVLVHPDGHEREIQRH